jgi:uncharacterized protein (UPF0333 family)
MVKSVLFVNAFLSYLLLLLLIVVVAGVAVFIGITLAKKKNKENDAKTIAGSAANNGVQKAEG